MLLNRMMNDLAPLMHLQAQMNRQFENAFEDMPSARAYANAYPPLNTWEDGDNAYVEAELPGLTMDDLEIYVTGNELRLGGERKIAEADGASWYRRERSQGRFARTLTLSWEIDADKVEATLKEGVLTVKLPKRESCKPRKVKVVTA